MKQTKHKIEAKKYKNETNKKNIKKYRLLYEKII